MALLKFKTNINCGGCVAAVTPILNKEEKIQKWEVALETKDRILTIETLDLDAKAIQEIVKEGGFNAEVLAV